MSDRTDVAARILWERTHPGFVAVGMTWDDARSATDRINRLVVAETVATASAIAAALESYPFIPEGDPEPDPEGEALVEVLAEGLCNDLNLNTVWGITPEDPHDADYPQGRELYRFAVRNLLARLPERRRP